MNIAELCQNCVSGWGPLESGLTSGASITHNFPPWIYPWIIVKFVNEFKLIHIYLGHLVIIQYHIISYHTIYIYIHYIHIYMYIYTHYIHICTLCLSYKHLATYMSASPCRCAENHGAWSDSGSHQVEVRVFAKKQPRRPWFSQETV